MKFLWHSAVIILCFGAVFAWTETPLVDYTIQALGTLVVVYLLISVIRRKKNPDSEFFGTTGDVFILTIAILLLITITGNLYSPLFFLVYFLGFGITFIFEPATVGIYALGIIAIFIPQALKNGSVESFLRLGSVLLIAPLAFFFGAEYRDRDKQETELEATKERVQDSAEIIEEDAKDVLDKEKNILQSQDVEKLDEVIEEAKDLEQETQG